jgi:hypothetical protein
MLCNAKVPGGRAGTKSRLYHHVQLLETLGLVQLVKTKPKRGTVEKYYSSVARHFTVDEKLLRIQPDSEAMDTLQGLMDGILETTRLQFRESIRSGLLAPEQEGTIAHKTVRASPAEIRQLEKKLTRWLDQVRAVDKKEGEEVYGVTVCFFPLAQSEQPKRKKRGGK